MPIPFGKVEKWNLPSIPDQTWEMKLHGSARSLNAFSFGSACGLRTRLRSLEVAWSTQFQPPPTRWREPCYLFMSSSHWGPSSFRKGLNSFGLPSQEGIVPMMCPQGDSKPGCSRSLWAWMLFFTCQVAGTGLSKHTKRLHRPHAHEDPTFWSYMAQDKGDSTDQWCFRIPYHILHRFILYTILYVLYATFFIQSLHGLWHKRLQGQPTIKGCWV